MGARKWSWLFEGDSGPPFLCGALGDREGFGGHLGAGGWGEIFFFFIIVFPSFLGHEHGHVQP